MITRHITTDEHHGVSGSGLKGNFQASFVRALQPFRSHAQGAYVYLRKLVDQSRYEIDETYLRT